MTTSTKPHWKILWCFVATIGGLVSCDTKPNASNSSTQEANTQSQVDINQEPSEIDENELLAKKFNPNAGRAPKDKDDYDIAIDAIKNYRKKRPEKHIHDHYVNGILAEKILKQKDVVGLRIYRVDSVRKDGQPAVGIIVTGVDKYGNDVKSTVKPEASGFVGDYMMSISYERCPRNCEGTRIFNQ